MRKTPSRTSPRSKGRACLCPDNTYSRKCCDGSLWAQGIGSLVGGGTSVILRGIEWNQISERWEEIKENTWNTL